MYEFEEEYFERINMKAIKKTCVILDMEEEIVKREIEAKKNGEIFCVYLICLQSKNLLKHSK